MGATCLKPAGGEVDALAERVMAPDPCRLVEASVAAACVNQMSSPKWSAASESTESWQVPRMVTCCSFGDLAEVAEHVAAVDVPKAVAEFVQDQDPAGRLGVGDERGKDELDGEHFHLGAVGGLLVGDNSPVGENASSVA